MKFQPLAIVLVTFSLVTLVGCSTSSPQKPTPFRSGLILPPKPAPDESGFGPQRDGAMGEAVQRQSTPPQIEMRPGAVAGLRADDALPPMGNAPASINVQDVPVPVLINEVFGSLLGLNVNMSPDVSKLDSLVTLNSRDQMRPRDLYQLARQVLAEYGVATIVDGDLVRFELSSKSPNAVPPLIVSGRALPDVPVSHRPVFQLVELEVVRSGDALRWMQTVFGQDLKVVEEAPRNALLISGKPAMVQQAVDALRVFDRPLMRGRLSVRIEPAFLTAEQLATSLMEVLNIQGYGAARAAGSPASVLVLPVASANSVLVFATTREGLDYATEWARELDRPGQRAGSASMFYYQVKNTKAADLAAVLSGNQPSRSSSASSQRSRDTGVGSSRDDLDIGSRSGGGGATSSAGTVTAARGNNANSRPDPTIIGSQFLVDEPRNALIYQGDPAQWERMLALIKQMDRAPRQVMIEVTIAEVTLTDKTSFGLSWFAKNGFGRFDGSGYLGNGSGGSAPTPGNDTSGLTYLLDVAGQNRVALNAFASDDRVTVLSTPRMLVKSGSIAYFEVGTEIPTISMTTTSSQQSEGNTNLLQSIQYRKTGTIMTITPTIYSGDRIDLDIEQQVSQSQALASDAAISSPSIFNRTLSTSLSLRDGGSVVMAGMISESGSNGDSGIPGLKDIPLLGNLFKSRSKSSERTELVLIIVPYIVESDERIDQLSQAIIDEFDLLELDRTLSLPPATAPNDGSVPRPAVTYPAKTEE